jgi:hypothetical protein
MDFGNQKVSEFAEIDDFLIRKMTSGLAKVGMESKDLTERLFKNGVESDKSVGIQCRCQRRSRKCGQVPEAYGSGQRWHPDPG